LEERHDSNHFALKVAPQAMTLEKGGIQRVGFSILSIFIDLLFRSFHLLDEYKLSRSGALSALGNVIIQKYPDS
jgi:hypothetical protein